MENNEDEPLFYPTADVAIDASPEPVNMLAWDDAVEANRNNIVVRSTNDQVDLEAFSQSLESLKPAKRGGNSERCLEIALEYKRLAARGVTTGNVPGAMIHTLVTAVLLKNARDLWQSVCDTNACREFAGVDWKMLDDEYVEVTSKLPSLKDALKQALAQPSAGTSQKKSDDDSVPCTEVKELQKVDCIYFSDLAGMSQAKTDLMTYFVNPLIYPNLYARGGSRSILLYGLPGTGKTFIAKAAVNELQRADPNVGVIFYSPTGAELKGKYVGETEKRIAAYFDCASKRATECGADGKKKYIAVLFIDEVEAIAGDRTQDSSGIMTNSVNVLLQKMDGIASHKNVVVLAATNFPDKLDSAIRRRFAREIPIPLPRPTEIQAVLQKELAKYAELSLDALQENTKKAEPDDTGSENTCGARTIRPACTAGPQRDPFDSLGYAITSKDLEEIAERMFLKHYSNSDSARLASYVINAAGNRALGGVFRPYRYKASDQVTYLSDFKAPSPSWSSAGAQVAGPFVDSGRIVYDGNTYESDADTMKTYVVPGARAAFRRSKTLSGGDKRSYDDDESMSEEDDRYVKRGRSSGSELLVVGAKTLGPYAVWFYIETPEPPRSQLFSWGVSSFGQIVARSKRVLLVKDGRVSSERTTFVIDAPSTDVLKGLERVVFEDANYVDLNRTLDYFEYYMTPESEAAAPPGAVGYLKYYLKDVDFSKIAVREMPGGTELYAIDPAAVGQADGNDVRKRLKTLYITKQDFADAMFVVKSSIRDSEKRAMDKISRA